MRRDLPRRCTSSCTARCAPSARRAPGARRGGEGGCCAQWWRLRTRVRGGGCAAAAASQPTLGAISQPTPRAGRRRESWRRSGARVPAARGAAGASEGLSRALETRAVEPLSSGAGGAASPSGSVSPARAAARAALLRPARALGAGEAFGAAAGDVRGGRYALTLRAEGAALLLAVPAATLAWETAPRTLAAAGDPPPGRYAPTRGAGGRSRRGRAARRGAAAAGERARHAGSRRARGRRRRRARRRQRRGQRGRGACGCGARRWRRPGGVRTRRCRPCRPSSPPPPLVLSGHAASLTPYQSDTPRPSPRPLTRPRWLSAVEGSSGIVPPAAGAGRRGGRVVPHRLRLRCGTRAL